ncbi:MAG: hypothetical protein V4796_32485 [Burkholderia cenocepacia]
MTEANYTQGNTEVQSTPLARRRRTADCAGLLAFFIGHIDIKQLDDEDLEFLSDASEQASGEAATLSQVVSGLGCLISEDAMRSGGSCTGSFQGDDVPNLLWFIANQIDSIGQMAFIGSEADYQLRTRAQAAVAAAVKKGASRG